jgi:uncharacterized protein (DUF302 family)
MSERNGYKREEVEFTGKRIRHYSGLGFDEVLARLRARVGETTLDKVVALSGNREEFEQKVQHYVGDSGFMLFSQIDHGRWIEKYGIKRRLLRWIFGNPLIAITMIQHDYSAGLFVPIETSIGKIARPKGIHIVPDMPKTRSGKIMRRVLAAISNSMDIGDVTTLANPEIVEQIRSMVQGEAKVATKAGPEDIKSFGQE